MMESFGPRPTAPSGLAAHVLPIQAEEKIVHRPDSRVLGAERVDRSAPYGPRPTFKHTYLEQLAASWPEEPEANANAAAPPTQPNPAFGTSEPAPSNIDVRV